MGKHMEEEARLYLLALTHYLPPIVHHQKSAPSGSGKRFCRRFEHRYRGII